MRTEINREQLKQKVYNILQRKSSVDIVRILYEDQWPIEALADLIESERAKAKAVQGELDSLLLDCWYQFAHENSKGRWDGGLSTLENLYTYLLGRGFVDEDGNAVAEARRPHE